MRKIFFVIIILIVLAGLATGFFYYKNNRKSQNATISQANEDSYLAFTGEVYDKIKTNYWDKIPDDQLSNLYKLAVEKVLGQAVSADPKTKADVLAIVKETIKDYDAGKKKDFVSQMADIVLANLKPFGRSRLYTTKQEQELVQNVNNVNPETGKTEPTVIYKLLTPDIFYIKLTKFSPQSFDELKKAADSIDPKKPGGPTALIFDLRGNVGGAIDILQYFLGPFIGPDQYAYEFFHQDEKQPFKTKTGWFDSMTRYKKAVILIDGETQSSAEVMAATLKKYNVGVTVGAPTKGWGTVESVIQLDHQLTDQEKFSIFMVNSITLREDGQPIESRGVDPAINITDKDWSKQLMAYFNYQPLVDQIRVLFLLKM